jgi:hypothetical protein
MALFITKSCKFWNEHYIIGRQPKNVISGGIFLVTTSRILVQLQDVFSRLASVVVCQKVLQGRLKKWCINSAYMGGEAAIWQTLRREIAGVSSH